MSGRKKYRRDGIARSTTTLRVNSTLLTVANQVGVNLSIAAERGIYNAIMSACEKKGMDLKKVANYLKGPSINDLMEERDESPEG